MAIIANQSYPSGSITPGVLKEIYRGEKSMEGSVRIRPVDQKDPVIKKHFLGKILGTTVDGYNGYWIKRVFQEGGVPPAIKGSPGEVIQVVGQEPGGIGYVWKSDVGGEKGIKLLLTIEVGE
ncbi:MAG: hypothetical protein HY760_08005 [Nitrospirae bacterium]|nr:hypothetical protein [Nitrospirota bacterium]